VSDTRENRPLPCPNPSCGHLAPVVHGDGPSAYVACGDFGCYMMGPFGNGKAGAITKWNALPRATRPQEAAAEVERCMSIKFPCAFCGDVVCPEEGCAAHTNGVELSNGEWVCSGECWEARQVEIWEAFAWWGTDWSTAALTQAEQRGDSAGYERGIRDASQTAQNVASGYAKIKNLDAQVAMRLFAAAILSKLSTPQTTNRE
jgi:hypothetical protein